MHFSLLSNHVCVCRIVPEKDSTLLMIGKSAQINQRICEFRNYLKHKDYGRKHV